MASMAQTACHCISTNTMQQTLTPWIQHTHAILHCIPHAHATQMCIMSGVRHGVHALGCFQTCNPSATDITQHSNAT
eukprot:4242655-Lingulodinium_polyedra.AAC.1